MKTNYLVRTSTKQDSYVTVEPEEAVAAFYREHSDLRYARVEVYVLDFIGTFEHETHIKRHPRATTPDSPRAKARAKSAAVG
jgi:hypothetical protein